MISAVALSPSLDITYVVRELRGIQRPLEVQRVGGGKALNAARAAARLGARARAVAVLGGGTGEAVRAAAEADGVTVEVVRSDVATRTCVSISSEATGELTEVYEHATPVPPALLDEVLERAEQLARPGPGWWLVSGGSPASLGDDAISRILGALHRTGSRVAVDSHGQALRAAVAHGQPDLVKINRAEAAELVALPLETSLADLLRAVQERTQCLVVLTDGVAGAAASDGSSGVHASLPGAAGRFPVGSGDAFLGGLLVALDDGADLAGAMRAATGVAAANAQVAGAGLFDRGAVEAFARRVEVTPIGL